jgi:hypothetical protein
MKLLVVWHLLYELDIQKDNTGMFVIHHCYILIRLNVEVYFVFIGTWL